MIINDVVYGNVEINEEVIIELINSKTFQRLKNICQQGVPEDYIMREQICFYRYEHCIGVMLCLKSLNASMEEQVAGLLHDVSHTAFSHLIDYVFGGESKEDYQDSMHHTYFSEGSELSTILERHGFDPERISKIKNYSLLEQEQPEMCADRFDYTLRYWAHIDGPLAIKKFLDGITLYDGVMVFKSFELAKEFAIKHTVWQSEWNGWGGMQYDMRIRWYLFGEALKYGMKNGIITKEDFLETDDYVMQKLINSNNKEIIRILDILKKQKRLRYIKGEGRLVLHSKFRYVDPKFIDNGKLAKLTDIDSEFKNDIENHRILNRHGITLSKIENIDVPIS